MILYNVICHYGFLFSETLQVLAYNKENAKEIAKTLALSKGYAEFWLEI